MVPGTWRVPDHRIMPELLEDARRYIAEKLKPAGEVGVHNVMVPLLFTTTVPATEGMSENTAAAFMEAKSAEYQRLLRDVPLDILQIAADACAKASPFFPLVADIFKHAQPLIDKRKSDAWRIDRLIEAGEVKAGTKAFEPEADDVKWRGDVERFHKFGKGLLHDRLRTRAIESERKLAELEGREPNLEQFGEEPAHIITPAKLGPELTGRSATTLIVDELEEPPPPTADHHANGEPL